MPLQRKYLISEYLHFHIFFLGHRICPPLESPDHGAINGQQFWEGKTVLYTCASGYQLSGTSVRRCLKDGTWTENKPECLPQKTGKLQIAKVGEKGEEIPDFPVFRLGL